MRKVEEQVIGAFLRRQNCKRGNTKSHFPEHRNYRRWGVLRLHGNGIAVMSNFERADRKFDVYVSLANHGTATTRSRLNAVCELLNAPIRFTQSKGEQYICYSGTDGEGNRWYMPELIEDWEHWYHVGVVE